MAAKKRNTKPTTRQSKRPPNRSRSVDLGDESELSPAQVRELESRIKDLENRTRYMLVSNLGPGFVLYYNVAEDTYGWNEASHATLFKRREAAEAIQQLLGDKDSVVECAVNKRGQLVKRSVVVPAEVTESTKKARRPKSPKRGRRR